MAGVILAGLAVVGFSLSKLIERVREKRAEREGEDVLATRRPSPACAEARTWPPKAGTLPW